MQGLAVRAVRLLHPVRGLERDVVSVPGLGLLAPERSRAASTHLKMMNVSHYIVKSKPISEGAPRSIRGSTLESTIGDYQIWRVKENARPLRDPGDDEARPRAHATRGRRSSYMWFKTATPRERAAGLHRRRSSPATRSSFARVSDGMPAEFPREPLGAPPVLQEAMENDRITITGRKPGYPILVRISYHPRWQALTGEKVWLAGPTLHARLPEGRPRGAARSAAARSSPSAACCTLIGWLLFLLAVLPTRPRARRGARAAREMPRVAGRSLRSDCAAWPRRRRRRGSSRRRCRSPPAIFTSAGVAAREPRRRTARTTTA